MAYETIIYEEHDRVAVLRLNRPRRMNAVIEEMYRELLAAFDRVVGSASVRAIVLTGSQLERDDQVRQAFCAGADLKKHAAGERSREEKRAYVELAHATTKRLFELPLPTIAAVNGPARGAGVELALNCDFLIMADSATLALPEIGLGTFVGGGVTLLLTRLVGLMRAKDLVYTGRVIDGPEAVRLGLALHSHPLEQLMERAMTLASELAERAPISLGLAKELLQRSDDRDMESALRLETEAILRCMESEDWVEGIRAFQDRRRPEFNGR